MLSPLWKLWVIIMWMGMAMGMVGTVLISSWKCDFSIYFDIQVITTLYAFYWFFMCWFLLFILPSIHSFFNLTTTFLESDVFWHSKAYSSCSFQPTGIGLGSLWRGNRCVLPIISICLYIANFLYKFLNLFILLKENVLFKKFSTIYYYYFFKKDNWAYVYMY